MQRDLGSELDLGISGGAAAARGGNSAGTAGGKRRFMPSLDVLRYGSAYLLLVLGAAAWIVGGWAPWVVLVLALAFGSFADEASGYDDISLKENRCLYCTVNLYLSLPLVCLLAFLLARFAAERSSLTASLIETIGAVWLTGYLFALVGTTVAHELTHRSGKLARASPHLLLGFTGNASFVIYHIHAHHRQVGTYHDAARRGERLRTFMARTLTQQFAQAADIEAARLRRKGLTPYSWRNELIVAHLVPLAILILFWMIGGWNGVIAIFLAGLIGRSFHELINYVQHYGLVRVENSPIRPHHSGDCYRTISNVLHYNLPRHSDHPYVRDQSFLAIEHTASCSDIALRLPDHGLHRAHPAAMAPHHEAVARGLGQALRERRRARRGARTRLGRRRLV